MDNKDRKRNISVAVDGPSGSGKSTLSRAAAKELSLVYVDTGAIYRTTALHILRRARTPGMPLPLPPFCRRSASPCPTTRPGCSGCASTGRT